MLAAKRAAKELAALRNLKSNKPLIRFNLLLKNYLKLILFNLGLILLLIKQIRNKIASFLASCSCSAAYLAASSYSRASTGFSTTNSGF